MTRVRCRVDDWNGQEWIQAPHVYRSDDPFDFGLGHDDKKTGTIAVAAPEVVLQDGQYFISSVHDLKGGIQLSRMG